jgi:putative oxidoreductase
MSNLIQRWQGWAPYMQSLLRIVAAKMFITFGTMKLFGYPIPMPAGNSAPVGSQTWIGGVLEVFGGGLMLLGLFTRPVAFLLSGEMAFAYFISHAPRNFYPALNGGNLAIMYCFVFLYFAFVGGGVWSLDARRSGSATV